MQLQSLGYERKRCKSEETRANFGDVISNSAQRALNLGTQYWWDGDKLCIFSNENGKLRNANFVCVAKTAENTTPSNKESVTYR